MLNCRFEEFKNNIKGKKIAVLGLGISNIPAIIYLNKLGAQIYAHDKIEIGDNCLIGANVKIIDNDFHPIDPVARLNSDPNIPHAPVTIGKNVFIGMNSIILKGTVIGDNCVVGAGSVVHGKFEDNCIIAGNPARAVKYLSAADN